MNGLRLSRRLALEALLPAPDGAGGLTLSWETLGSVWADLRPGTARQVMTGGLARSEIRQRIILRNAPRSSPQYPAPGQRLREGGRVWSVIAVSGDDPDPRYLTCHVIEEVPA